jgi:hypothetical protein
MTASTATPFDRITEEALYAGFDPAEPPDPAPYWDETTLEPSEEWNKLRQLWSKVKTYRTLHSAKYIPIPTAYEIPRPLRAWADEILNGSPIKPLLVSGVVGVGKTHGVCALACYLGAFWDRSIYVDAPPIIFHTASRMLSQLKDFGSKDAREKLFFASINAKILVIDDLTRSKITDHDMETLGQLVDDRMSKNLPIILTLNHDADQTELKDLLPPFLASRLESGQHIRILGTDRRA